MKTLHPIFHELGGIVLFYLNVFKTAFNTKGNLSAIIEQIAFVSYRSLSTVLFAGLFVGAIIALQFNTMLAQYDASVYVGGLNTSVIIREVGPLIISFLLAGKIGAFTAAELGTMRVTEQIDAIECLGTNPIQYLIIPRFFGIVFSSLLLLGLGLIISIIGAIITSMFFYGINPLQFVSTIPKFTSEWTICCGAFKSLIYGLIVAGVACFKGFTATGGAKGVGKAVTQAAVFTNLYIVIANYFSTNFLEAIHQWSMAFYSLYLKDF